MLAAVVSHRDTLCVEGAGLDDIYTYIEVAAMDISNNLRFAQTQQVVVPFLQTRQVGKTLATEVLF